MSRFVIACGGTGGHLAPGIAIAEVLQGRGHYCLLLISEKDVDSALVQKYGHLRFRKITGRAFAGGFWGRVASAFALQASMRQARQVLRKERPDAVLLFGGFLSLGLGVVARLSKIPVLLHEANCVPGKTTLVLKHFAARIYLPDGVRLKGVEPRRIRYYGYPVRSEIKHILKADAWRKLRIEVPRKLLVVIGGSQGAKALNNWVVQNFEKMSKIGISVYCVTGLRDSSGGSTRETSEDGLICSATMVPFSGQMGDVVSAADLVISRAGAGSIAEIIRCRAPAILIPYPYAADDHQKANARSHEQHGAGMMIDEQDLESLWSEVEALIYNDWLLAKFKSNLERLDRFDSSERIATDLESLVEFFEVKRDDLIEEVMV